MANNSQFSDGNTITMVAARCADLDSGFIQVLTGTQPTDANQALTGTLLAQGTFGSTAFGTPTAAGSAGSRIVTATANSITGGTAGNSGTAGYFAVLESDGTTVVGMGSVGTSDADLNFNSLAITSGAAVTFPAFTITQPET